MQEIKSSFSFGVTSCNSVQKEDRRAREGSPDRRFRTRDTVATNGTTGWYVTYLVLGFRATWCVSSMFSGGRVWCHKSRMHIGTNYICSKRINGIQSECI